MMNDEYLKIKIPNLLDYPFSIQQVELNGNVYFFEYFWNTRHNKAYFSLFTKKDNVIKYLIKNICLKAGIYISKNIYDEDWSGKLSFGVNDSIQEEDYRIDTISEDFYITYIPEE